MLNHLEQYWTNHLAAASGTAYCFFGQMSLQGFIQSVFVGITIFIISSGLKLIWKILH